MSIITLTTDFGTRDWFVGSMKGMILGSTGYLEIAVNSGNAAQALGLKFGDVVEVA